IGARRPPIGTVSARLPDHEAPNPCMPEPRSAAGRVPWPTADRGFIVAAPGSSSAGRSADRLRDAAGRRRLASRLVLEVAPGERHPVAEAVGERDLPEVQFPVFEGSARGI